MPTPIDVIALIASDEDWIEEQIRRVEAIEQLTVIVAAYGEVRVLRWVKFIAGQQSGTGL